MPKNGESMALMIGLGKPKNGAPESDEEGEGSEKELAGNELKDALKSGDGAAICEAVKRIVELESYGDED